MASTVDQIKERLDLVDLVQQYVRLQKAGINFKAPCPFHNEKTPSFFVSPERQIWHCFGGCSEGGDHFKFIMKIEGLEFGEALRLLAKKAGVELKDFAKQDQTERNKLLEVSELAAKFFEKQLWESENGKKALKYLVKNRGLKEETIKEWRLGFAPANWNSLKVFLKNSGYSDEEIHKAGLTIKRDEEKNQVSPASPRLGRGRAGFPETLRNGAGPEPSPPASYGAGPERSFYDRFRGRIMFPISDFNSQVVGFTGRVFETRPELVEGPVNPSTHSTYVQGGEQSRTTGSGLAEAAKYINTPQTLIYDKSRILYGLDKAKAEIRKADRVVTVEGNMDVIMSHQAGVKNAVASSGTALTVQHLRIIKRYTQNLDLCFDRDLAGQTAAKRGIDLALAKEFNVGVVNLEASSKNPRTSREATVRGGPRTIAFGELRGRQESREEKIKDVADLVKLGQEKWQEVSQKSIPIIQFYIDNAFEKHDPGTALGKKNIAKEVLPVIKLMENKVEQAYWLDLLAVKLAIDQRILAQVLSATKINQFRVAEEEENNLIPERSSRLALEETLLALFFKAPAKAKEIQEEEFEIFTDKLYNTIFAELKEKGSLSALPPDSYEDALRVELIKFKSEQFFNDLKEEEAENEISRLVKSIKREYILEKIIELENKIKQIKSDRADSLNKETQKAQIVTLLEEVQKFSSKLAVL